MTEGICHICYDLSARIVERGGAYKIDCQRCGGFFLHPDTIEDMGDFYRSSSEDTLYTRALFSHFIRRAQKNNSWPKITYDFLEKILKEQRLPNASDQADNLISYLGSVLQSPEEIKKFNLLAIASEIGAANSEGVEYILEHLKSLYLVSFKGGGHLMSLSSELNIGLLFSGWKKYESLKKEHLDSRKAFMAMSFSNISLTKILNENLIPEVRKTGFELRRLDHEPKAGLIDNLLREAITQSKFLVADLTDSNPGAYWEAGFAEGLGRPVFYMCEKSVWDEKKTHFDTEHYQTIVWDSADPDKAAKSLKAAIRVTLRSEAQLNDE